MIDLQNYIDEKGIWWNRTWSPWTGCSHSGSEGCDHCWARAMARMWRGNQAIRESDGALLVGPEWSEASRRKERMRVRRFEDVVIHPEKIEEPLRWRKPREPWVSDRGYRVFVCPMSDFSHLDVPHKARKKCVDIMVQCQKHTFIVPTKRPETAIVFLEIINNTTVEPDLKSIASLPGNIQIWISVSTQKELYDGIVGLLKIPCAVRGIMIEPMLEEIDLSRILDKKEPCSMGCYSHVSHACDKCGRIQGRLPIHGVVVGGETGPRARPLQPDWVRRVRDACLEAHIPFFLKRLGSWWDKFGDDPNAVGRVLDGRTWDQWPCLYRQDEWVIHQSK